MHFRRKVRIVCFSSSILSYYLLLRSELDHNVAVLNDGAVHMDQSDDCDRVITQTQDLVEGDLFLVKSDVYGGKASLQRQPAECSVTFNFGGRRLAVAVVDWTCERPHREIVLAIYSDCNNHERTSKPLVSRLHCAVFVCRIYLLCSLLCINGL